jgi:Pvc16 N-terminal domain/Carboxypeptidase regulatory-like domain
MLSEVHNTIAQLLYVQGKIEPLEVDVSFDPPTREYINSRITPTVNFFLHDLEENTELRQAGLESRRFEREGRQFGSTSQPPRRFDLHYMVSAITSNVADEHELLWRVTTTLMRNRIIPDQFLPQSVLDLGIQVQGRVSQPDDGPRPQELWSTLETTPRPALLYVMTVPVNMDLETEAPLVLTRSVKYTEIDGGIYQRYFHIGGRVLDKLGGPIPGASVTYGARESLETDSLGRFVIPKVLEGEIELEVTLEGKKPQRVKLNVPSENYNITL